MKIIYERDPDVGNGFQAFRGTFAGEKETQGQSFEGLHFSELLRRTQELLLQWNDRELVFIRSDRPELLPHRLADDLTALIVEDVDKAIEKMSHPDVRVVVGRPAEQPSVIRAGTETLAAALGERVLCRWRDGRMECPGCGAWADTKHRSMSCAQCKMQLLFEPEDAQWVSISVSDLVGTHASKFFLPREWNGYKPWIERKELAQMLEQTLKAKGVFDAVE